MNRLIKLSRLLKLSINSAGWSAVLAEVDSEALPDYPELAQLEEAGKKADELNVKATEANNSISKFDQQQLTELQNAAKSGALDAMIAQLQTKSARISQRQKEISKRAGFMSSMFSFGGKLLPVIGVIWAGYDAYHNWVASEAAASAIKNHFVEFGSGDDLFHPDYIANLIQKNRDNPEKMLSIAKLNKIAKFYKIENLGKWFSGAMSLLSFVETIAMVPSFGLSALATGFWGGVLAAIGITSAGADVAVETFGQLTEGFRTNSETIRSIATENTGSQPTSEETETEPETAEEGPEI